MKTTHLNLRAAMVSLLMFLVFLGAWQLSATAPSVAGAAKAGMSAEEIEYQKMMGKDPGAVKTTGFPPPLEVGKAMLGHLADPFYDKGPNDKGIGIQLGHSLGRVALGFFLAVLVALPVGFMIGMSPLMRKAFDPFIQVLKPISPLAWMPLALYTLKDSEVSGIFVIFICSVWPMLMRMPVTMVGAAAGKITKKALRSGCTSNVLATLSQSRLTAATPKAVLINIGQTEQMKITKMPLTSESLSV